MPSLNRLYWKKPPPEFAMIKIEKDLTVIPAPLVFPAIGRQAKAVQAARERLIRNGEYPKTNTSSTDKHYKSEPIKAALSAIYHDKCAFCEQRVEQWPVEHFRPKSIYFWLAFSWDNLLYACPVCNGFKSNFFGIYQFGPRATLPPTFVDINSLSLIYDAAEQPILVNPEREDIEHLLFFKRDGLISSRNIRVAATILACKINRPYLNDYRKKILDDFENDLRSEAAENQSEEELRIAVKALIARFHRASLHSRNEFLAFRRFAVRELIDDILKNVLTETQK